MKLRIGYSELLSEAERIGGAELARQCMGARRARQAAQRRQTWHAFKASRRQSVTLQQIIDEYEKEQR